MKDIIIKISESSDGEGYLYDIYDSEEALINCDDSLDGGQCTTTLENALDMAVSQTKDLLKKTCQHIYNVNPYQRDLKCLKCSFINKNN